MANVSSPGSRGSSDNLKILHQIYKNVKSYNETQNNPPPVEDLQQLLSVMNNTDMARRLAAYDMASKPEVDSGAKKHIRKMSAGNVVLWNGRAKNMKAQVEKCINALGHNIIPGDYFEPSSSSDAPSGRTTPSVTLEAVVKDDASAASGVSASDVDGIGEVTRDSRELSSRRQAAAVAQDGNLSGSDDEYSSKITTSESEPEEIGAINADHAGKTPCGTPSRRRGGTISALALAGEAGFKNPVGRNEGVSAAVRDLVNLIAGKHIPPVIEPGEIDLASPMSDRKRAVSPSPVGDNDDDINAAFSKRVPRRVSLSDITAALHASVDEEHSPPSGVPPRDPITMLARSRNHSRRNSRDLGAQGVGEQPGHVAREQERKENKKSKWFGCCVGE